MLIIPVPVDSARQVVLAALQHEALVVDGTPASDRSEFVTTFLVRRGGMGETEIRLRLQLSPDAAETIEGAGTTLRVEGSARDVARRMLMSPEDARAPRLSREPHPIQDNDRESLQRIARLLDRLQQLGWTRIPDP
ncbi:MAG: hypothetical protein IPF98_24225 [Gemmatimonadetes bacterium]|nr:hypothetical protein [Gemmatimonadota bacterium]